MGVQGRVKVDTFIAMERMDHAVSQKTFALFIQNPIGESISNVVSNTNPVLSSFFGGRPYFLMI